MIPRHQMAGCGFVISLFLWPHALNMPVITNGAESCRGHVNAKFNANIYTYLSGLCYGNKLYRTLLSVQLLKSHTISRVTCELFACLDKLSS